MPFINREIPGGKNLKIKYQVADKSIPGVSCWLIPGLADLTYEAIWRHIDNNKMSLGKARATEAFLSYDVIKGLDSFTIQPTSRGGDPGYTYVYDYVMRDRKLQDFITRCAAQWVGDRSPTKFQDVMKYTVGRMKERVDNDYVRQMRSESSHNIIDFASDLKKGNMGIGSLIADSLYVNGAFGMGMAFKNNGEFDLKRDPKVKEIMNGNDYLMIPGDDKNAYLPDFVGNIHFGYIVCSALYLALNDAKAIAEINRNNISDAVVNFGKFQTRMIGISKDIAEYYAGTHDPADDLAARLGAQLWLDRGYRLNVGDLENAIVSNRNKWTRKPIDFVSWAKSRFKNGDGWEYVKKM